MLCIWGRIRYWRHKWKGTSEKRKSWNMSRENLEAEKIPKSIEKPVWYDVKCPENDLIWGQILKTFYDRKSKKLNIVWLRVKSPDFGPENVVIWNQMSGNSFDLRSKGQNMVWLQVESPVKSLICRGKFGKRSDVR